MTSKQEYLKPHSDKFPTVNFISIVELPADAEIGDAWVMLNFDDNPQYEIHVSRQPDGLTSQEVKQLIDDLRLAIEVRDYLQEIYDVHKAD